MFKYFIFTYFFFQISIRINKQYCSGRIRLVFQWQHEFHPYKEFIVYYGYVRLDVIINRHESIESYRHCYPQSCTVMNKRTFRQTFSCHSCPIFAGIFSTCLVPFRLAIRYGGIVRPIIPYDKYWI